MKITNIEFDEMKYYNTETLIPYLLKNNIDNEKEFQSVLLSIDIVDMDHPMDFVYRLFYEDIYLKNHNSDYINPCVSWYDNEEKILHLKASLSELIGYINMTAPPLIVNLIKKQGYETLQEFVDVLKELLIEQGEKVPYYISKFKECMGMNHFTTKTTYNFERMDTLRTINDGKTPLIDIEAIHGASILGLVENVVDDVSLQCMINILDDNHVSDNIKLWLYPILEEMNMSDSVINVYHDDKRGYFIEINIPSFSSCDYPELSKRIFESYNKLVK